MENDGNKDEHVRIDGESYKIIKETALEDKRSIKATISIIVDFFKKEKSSG